MEEQNLQAMLIETCRLIYQNNFLQIVQFQWQESLLLTRISNEIRDIAHRRICPFDSGLWISMKFALLTGHVIAVLIAFIVFRIDRPQAPLYFWVAGYSVGCAATFPVFCWRYARISPAIPLDEFLDFSSSSASDLSPEPCVSFGIHPASRYDGPQSDNAISRHYQAFSRSDPRLDIVMERFKVVLDCFFALWIVVGNILIFGVPSSPSDSPNFYRSSIVFLTFCCVRYALPFVICTFLCYCLAYITRAVGFQEEETHVREASENIITALPILNYKAICSNYRNSGKRGRDIKSEFPSTGGFIAAGTEGEKEIPSEDAVCCICLEKYKDDEGLRVLPCEHHFHVGCVDKWLKISGSCPLCKHKISGSSCPGDEFLESFLC